MEVPVGEPVARDTIARAVLEKQNRRLLRGAARLRIIHRRIRLLRIVALRLHAVVPVWSDTNVAIVAVAAQGGIAGRVPAVPSFPEQPAAQPEEARAKAAVTGGKSIEAAAEEIVEIVETPVGGNALRLRKLRHDRAAKNHPASLCMTAMPAQNVTDKMATPGMTAARTGMLERYGNIPRLDLQAVADAI
jgi:hypothetical protein